MEERGFTKNSQSRLCKVQRETVQFLLDGYKMLASSDYLARDNRALMVMAVAWAKEQKLLHRNVQWYQEKWNRRHVLENSQANLVFDDWLKPDLMLEEKQMKTIWICDIAYPQENNIVKNRLEKSIDYWQLASEVQSPGFKVQVVLLVISAFGGAVKEILKQLENMFEKDDLCEKIVAEMQKTILMDSESIIRKVLSGLVQSHRIIS